MKNIPVADPYITEEDVETVMQAVKNKRLSQGEYVDEFEENFANYTGCKYAFAVINGTAALHLSLLALDIEPGDEVIVPSFTFIATANCVLYVRARPVFVDIDPKTYNIDPKEIEKAISPRTKAVIPVHYAGQPAEMDPIMETAEKHNLQVVEDAAEAHGALYKGRRVGAIGKIGCFSFYPNKNMTTGEGGMIVTNDDQIAEKIRLFRNQGQDSRYHHIVIGYNYRMTDIQAALGIVQLSRLDWVLQKKKEAAEYYETLFEDVNNLKIPYVLPYATHSYMLYTIRFQKRNVRDNIMQHLNERGIDTRITFPPVHLQPIYRSLYGYSDGFLPVTEKTAENVLSIPIYPHIKKEDQSFIVGNIREGLESCRKFL
jgi:dTDP-4-amino-4,6-dideoxygalactose transaminase